MAKAVSAGQFRDAAGLGSCHPSRTRVATNIGDPVYLRHRSWYGYLVTMIQLTLIVLAILAVPAFIWLGVLLERRRRR
jgi:hypothetical protein